MNRILVLAAAALGVAAASILLPAAAGAQSPAEQRGLTFVNANCSGCHATDKISASRLPLAPPFRDLHRRYPVESLARSFAEGIRTGHPTMPEFRLDPGQVRDVIAYLKSFER